MVAQLPFGRGRLVGGGMGRPLDLVVGGWQGSTTFTFQTGQPMPISMANPRLTDGNQRPDVACAQVLTGISVHRAAFTDQPYLNAGCFADPGDQQAGDAPRYFSNIREDGIHNFDVSFSENITSARKPA
jgi:hypothetical protein